MARIYVVEDDSVICGELVRLLQRNGHETMHATRFDHLVDDILASEPDMVLLDLSLPCTDGQYVCRELRQASSVPIIVVTSRTTDLDELMSMTMGADDFVSKPYNGQVLLAHIDALLRRVHGAQEQGRVLEHNGVSLDLARSLATCTRGEGAGKSVELTKNELRILSMLMRRAGRIVSREDLMCELWNSDAFIDDNTLTVNVNRPAQHACEHRRARLPHHPPRPGLLGVARDGATRRTLPRAAGTKDGRARAEERAGGGGVSHVGVMTWLRSHAISLAVCCLGLAALYVVLRLVALGHALSLLIVLTMLLFMVAAPSWTTCTSMRTTARCMRLRKVATRRFPSWTRSSDPTPRRGRYPTTRSSCSAPRQIRRSRACASGERQPGVRGGVGCTR